MQSRQPLQTSCWMKTVSNSVRTMASVGQTSRQLALAQCLQTSDIIDQAIGLSWVVPACSTNRTCRQLAWSSWPVLSQLPRNSSGLLGRPFHSLHATSQALHPMQSLVSVKDPTG